MKQINLTAAKARRGMSLVLCLTSILLITSCQKEQTTNPDTPPLPDIPITATLNNLSSTLKTYKIVAPINLYRKNNITINGDSIAGGGTACIQLIECNNVHITHCRLGHSSSFGILIANCTNVLVDSCYVTKVATGILAVNCPGGMIRVMSNQLLNMQGPFPQGSAIQFSGVGGHYNRIYYNKIDNVSGQNNGEDKISLYKSNGVAGDPIYVIGNWVRGSGTSTVCAGINLGDQGGSYQVAQSNIVVNSGADGIQIAGGNNIQVLNNSIYGAAFSWSHLGLCCGNYTSLPMYNITMSNNKVNWTSGNPKDQINGKTTRVLNAAISTSVTTTVIGWSTNILGANINASILPAKILDYTLY